MNALTKDQIRQLTPEQQETIATMEITRMKKREKLLLRARGSSFGIIVGLPVLVAGIFVLNYYKTPNLSMLVFIGTGLWSLLFAINRRLDAIIELLGDDKINGDGIRHNDAA
jgi:hypothetical protein